MIPACRQIWSWIGGRTVQSSHGDVTWLGSGVGKVGVDIVIVSVVVGVIVTTFVVVDDIMDEVVVGGKAVVVEMGVDTIVVVGMGVAEEWVVVVDGVIDVDIIVGLMIVVGFSVVVVIVGKGLFPKGFAFVHGSRGHLKTKKKFLLCS